jgi:DNA-binding GntR family transcriptional regulator
MKRSVDLGEDDPRSYVRLAARIRRQILNGELEPGRRVPSITALSKELRSARDFAQEEWPLRGSVADVLR